ncbi:hypothetical protein EII29_03905 [Leptotrichia sp. OH3620_COT-345]|uniref:hypothetical protein n=1 Tax=Leptotrichia sp. OH3620_COT-345 TaxID=2491048 RepID=UPI000F64886A|nr:hypothetical protein [Leptotrichia sp. OH3620_COT-345]RRD40252.1 hypothetical protein EII29_03905 [Leptotrichia sp. OH3620_COT-345]
MEFLFLIFIVIFVLLAWGGLSYLMYYSVSIGMKKRINSPKITDEKILKDYKTLNNFIGLFIFYGGIVGFFLAKKKFIPELKKILEEKMRERNISF